MTTEEISKLSGMPIEEISKHFERGTMKDYNIPLLMTESFISMWNSKEESEKRAMSGMFIHLTANKEKDSTNVLAFGLLPEYALFFVGVSWGASSKRIQLEMEELKNKS